MISTPPWPDESPEPDTAPAGEPAAEPAAGPAAEPADQAAWEVVGSAGRSAIRADEVDRAARTYWEAEADAYQAEHGAFLAGAASTGFVWGPEGLTEEVAQLLGPPGALPGRRILEVGCGAAQCTRWLAARRVRAVGVDIALNQLRHSRRQDPPGDVVAATATALPFPSATFDTAFAAYGAIQFVADLPGLLAEVRRVLIPGGHWVFSVTHPIRWAFPDDPGPAGLAASGSYFDRTPYVERDGSGAAVYAEFHRTLGDYVNGLVGAGFTLETVVEPEWPDWNSATWGGWSPLRGMHLPGTLILGCRADA